MEETLVIDIGGTKTNVSFVTFFNSEIKVLSSDIFPTNSNPDLQIQKISSLYLEKSKKLSQMSLSLPGLWDNNGVLIESFNLKDWISYPFIKNYKKVMAEFRGFAMNFYIGRRDSFNVAESILQALQKRPTFGNHLNAAITSWSKKLIRFAQRTASLPLQKYTNEQLWKIYDRHDQLHTKLYTHGWLPGAVDMFHNNLTDRLKRYLASVCRSRGEVESAFVLCYTDVIM